MIYKLVGLIRHPFTRPLRQMASPLTSWWPWPVGVPLPTGHVIYVDLRSAIGRGIMVKGTFDPALADLIHNILKPGDIFVDVGANVGYFALVALHQVGSEGEVHAFEVDPHSLRCLWKTQRRNMFSNFIIHGVALGERVGVNGLDVTPELGHTRLQITQHRSVLFPVLPLDVWCEYFLQRGLTLMKVDVEGAELLVLRGAKKILERLHPVVICEAVESHLRGFGGTVAEMVRFMEDLGYRVQEIKGTFDKNLLFVSQDR